MRSLVQHYRLKSGYQLLVRLQEENGMTGKARFQLLDILQLYTVVRQHLEKHRGKVEFSESLEKVEFGRYIISVSSAQ